MKISIPFFFMLAGNQIPNRARLTVPGFRISKTPKESDLSSVRDLRFLSERRKGRRDSYARGTREFHPTMQTLRRLVLDLRLPPPLPSPPRQPPAGVLPFRRREVYPRLHCPLILIRSSHYVIFSLLFYTSWLSSPFPRRPLSLSLSFSLPLPLFVSIGFSLSSCLSLSLTPLTFIRLVHEFNPRNAY